MAKKSRELRSSYDDLRGVKPNNCMWCKHYFNEGPVDRNGVKAGFKAGCNLDVWRFVTVADNPPMHGYYDGMKTAKTCEKYELKDPFV